MNLKDYASKRKFEKTPEPEPGPEPRKDRLVFVVHKHAASRLHYDLRLEMEGVLKSWAVPKGPSLDPSVKRMAVHVEDHPLEYRDFEGVIPEGNYGAGSVIIWDRGVYRHPSTIDEEESERLLLEGFRKGDLKFVLAGRKLRGEFALVKMARDAKTWLLLKKKDRYATADPVLTENRSVQSQKTLLDVSADDREELPAETENRIRVREAMESALYLQAPEQSMPAGIQPMLATLTREPFDHPDWLFEVKWDGYRAIAEVREGAIALSSRNGLSLERKFPPVAEALRKLRFDAVLDGEVVVVDDQGRPDFQALQHYTGTGKGRLLYYVFDLLHFAGRDLTGLPLRRRKELLKQILASGPTIRVSDHVAGEGKLFFQVVKEKGLEGIVAKHRESTYEPGRRSRQWLKVKTQLTQEAVIGGFTEPGGGRNFFGSLVLGMFEGDTLVPVGSVGSGFSEKDLQHIRERLEPFIIRESPFGTDPETAGRAIWVRPELVCEVAFSGWTSDAVMRHPVFLRLREDKQALDVRKEEPMEQTGGSSGTAG
ncbi:MAG: non-homologous end-joining DNA ligase [Nitrospiraceae bacterium]|nr:non-homologous end-joining DNA ligase [Nitrospiraceae bacterium]